MDSIRYARAEMEHLELLAATMRPADVLECEAGGHAPLESLLRSCAASDFAATTFLGGELAAVWGVGPLPGQTLLGGRHVGVAWCLTSAAVERHPVAYLGFSRAAIRWMLGRYDVLVNFVDVRYAAALRWLSRLGFEVRPPVPHGPLGHFFHPVTRRRSPWAATSPVS